LTKVTNLHKISSGRGATRLDGARGKNQV